MIHVDRPSARKPEVLDSWLAETERADARKWFGDPKRNRQERFPFGVYKRPEVSDALNELFHGKCAYCETLIQSTTTPADVELYRPKGSVAESPDHPGYWWLASDWDNMLTSCADCNRVRSHAGERAGKGSRFPLADDAKRAFKPGAEVDEAPLLLNPCLDSPEQVLVFDRTGEVVSSNPRGQATISVLALNRAHLVAARRASANELLDTIRSLDTLLAPVDRSSSASRKPPLGSQSATRRHIKDLTSACSAAEEFAGMKRQLARPMLDRLRKLGLIEKEPDAVSDTPVISKARKTAAKSSWGQYVEEQSSFSLETEHGRATYKSERRLIESVSIRNVKAIRELDLDMTAAGSGRTPWLMLLGENGTGKSTILQAIALTLIGASALVRLGGMGVHPRDYIRYRCKSGSVSVKLSGFKGPHRLTFRSNHVEFTTPTGEQSIVKFGPTGQVVEGSGWEPQMIVLGYGATRLLPRDLSPAVTSHGDTFSRIDNLFNPFVPLRDADSWMAGLKDVQFDSASLVLKDLLSLAAKARFEVDKDKRVIVADHGERVPLRQLSDGYQSVVATAVDILDVMTTVWPNLLDAEGIVLLDEIGAHLHPTWKMRIVSSIRRAAPGVQFVTSTHDPLCLRGLGGGEVVVMKRDANYHVLAVTGLPSPADFRIDQLLTSSFFGLNSTIDPETDQDFTTYYALLAMPKRTEAEADQLRALQAKLKDRRFLGVTPRDQLMYGAVDQLLADHRDDKVQRIPDLQEAAVAAVSKIWATEDDEASRGAT
jgi:uncharacterized protein (TIGR02646 family)